MKHPTVQAVQHSALKSVKSFEVQAVQCKAVQTAERGTLQAVKGGAVQAVQSGENYCMKGGDDDPNGACRVGGKIFIKVIDLKIHFE